MDGVFIVPRRENPLAQAGKDIAENYQKMQQLLFPLLYKERLYQQYEVPQFEREMGLRESQLMEAKRQHDIESDITRKKLASDELTTALARQKFIDESLNEIEQQGLADKDVEYKLQQAELAGIPKDMTSAIRQGLQRKKVLKSMGFMKSMQPKPSWIIPPIGIGGIARRMGYQSVPQPQESNVIPKVLEWIKRRYP